MESIVGCVNCRLCLVLAHIRHLCDDIARGRVEDIKRLVAARTHPDPVDEALV